MNTFLLTTDFSKASYHALKYAASMAADLGAGKLIIYHAQEGEGPSASWQSEHEKIIEKLEQMRNEITTHFLPDQTPHFEIMTNEMPVEIGVQLLAEQFEADLIIVGATGKSPFRQAWVGSSATRMAATTRYPLLIVPENAHFKPIRRVVFACDLKQVSESTPVKEIGKWLNILKANLLVLNVAKEKRPFDPDIIPEQYKIHQLLEPFNPDYHYTQGDDIADEIEDFAEDHSAGIIVSVPKPHSFFERVFQKSVTKQLMRESDIPVLVLNRIQ